MLTALIGCVFIIAGLAKIAGQQEMLDQFDRFGYPIWFMYLVGLVEIVGGVGLIVPRTTQLAALLLAPLMLGATATHLIHDPLVSGLPAITLFLLLAYVFWRVRSITQR